MSKKIAFEVQELYNKAEVLIEKKKYEEALSILNKVLNIEPEYADAMSKIGTVHTLLIFKQMSKEEVIKLSERALELNNHSPVVWTQMGIAHMIKIEFDKAITCFQKAINLKPDYSKAWNGMGVAYLTLKKYDIAIECLQKAITIKPDYAMAFNNIGLTYLNRKDYVRALEYSQRAIDIDPEIYNPWNNIGIVHLNNKAYNKALNCFQKVIDLKPDHFQAWNGMGVAFLAIREYNKAFECFQKTIEFKSDFFAAWNSMGSIYIIKKEFDKALECFEKAVKLKPDSIASWNNLGLIYLNLKNSDKALTCFQKVIDLKPDHLKAWNSIGLIYKSKKKYGKAIECLEKALEFDPNIINHVAYHSQIGYFYFQLGQFEKTIEEQNRSLDLKKDYPPAIWEKSLAYRKLKKYQKAVFWMQEYIKLKPKEHLAYYQIGLNLRNLGNYKEAIKAHNHALDLKKDFAVSMFEKGKLYIQLGNFKEAITPLREYLTLKPNDHSAYYQLGYCLREIGQYEKALQIQDCALKIKKDYIPPLWEKHYSYIQLEKHQDAINQLKKSLELKPNDFLAYYLIAESYMNLEKWGDCLEAINKALELKPSDKDALILKKQISLVKNINETDSIDEKIRLAIALDENQPELKIKDGIEEILKDFRNFLREEGPSMNELSEALKIAKDMDFSLKDAFQSEEFKKMVKDNPDMKNFLQPLLEQIQAGPDKILPGSDTKIMREILKDNALGGFAEVMSDVSDRMADIDESIIAIDEAIQEYRKKGNNEMVAKFLLKKGKNLIELGEINSGINAIEEALIKFEKLGNNKGIVKSLIEKGKYEIFNKNYEIAISYLERATKIAQNIKNKNLVLYCCTYVLLGYLESGKIEELVRFFAVNERIFDNFFKMEGIEDQELILLYLETFGRASMKISKDYENALTIFQTMEKYGIIFFKSVEVAKAHYYEGLCYHRLKRYSEALIEFNKALDHIQKQIKGKELDFKAGVVKCPNTTCKQDIQIKITGITGAIIETCTNCNTQFSLWVTEPQISKCYLTVLSDDIKVENSSIHSIYLQKKKGRKTSTKIANLLNLGAMITSQMAFSYKDKNEYLNAVKTFFQAASMYQALGLVEQTEINLNETRGLFPKIEIKDQELLNHEIQRLLKQTPENLRGRDFTYIFISCPNCGTEHQIRASLTTVADEFCSKCQVKFSVFYNDETQEFYTNILEKPKIKTLSQAERKETDLVKFCARCGLNISIIARFCTRCGLKIVRE
ncbi:MAG: tetratricopeptide repeat protein [Promethearchaeota archaeon]